MPLQPIHCVEEIGYSVMVVCIGMVVLPVLEAPTLIATPLDANKVIVPVPDELLMI